MPFAARGSNTLYDAASAPEPATALEASLEKAWAARHAALSAGGALAWPADAAPAADTAAALVFASAAAPGGAAVAEAAVRLLASAPAAAAAPAAGALAALAGPHWRVLHPAVAARLAAAVAALVAARAPSAEVAAAALIRHVRTGSVAPDSVALATPLLTGLASALDWVAERPPLAQAALLASLAVLPAASRAAPTTPTLTPLVAAATSIAVRLLTERWPLAAGCGRDLARCLREAAEAAQGLAAVWAALLAGCAPGAAAADAGAPGYAAPRALTRLLARRTPPRLLLSRLPPDAEAALYFMLTSVRSGNQRRYQSWYAARHLARDGAEATAAVVGAVADATRYVAAVYHPPASVHASDVLPRWACLGWLLQWGRGEAVAEAARVATLLDWLFFDAATDSVASVEPAALVLVRSIPKYAAVTNGLLAAAAAAVDTFAPPAAAAARAGLAAGADALIARGVVRSFDGLADAPEVDAELRAWVRERLCGGGGGVAAAPDAAPPALAAETRAPEVAATPQVCDSSAATAEPAPASAAPPATAKRRRARSQSPSPDGAAAPPELKRARPPAAGVGGAPVDAALAALKVAARADPADPDALLAAATALLAALAPPKPPPRGGRGRKAATPAPDAVPVATAVAGVVALADDAAAGRTTVPWAAACDGGAAIAPPAADSLFGALAAAALTHGAPPAEATGPLFAGLRDANATADTGWRLLAAVWVAQAALDESGSDDAADPADDALALYAAACADPRACLEADLGAALAAAGPAAVGGALAPLLRALGEPPPAAALKLVLAAADDGALLAASAALATARARLALGRATLAPYVDALCAWPAPVAGKAWRLLGDEVGGAEAGVAAVLSALAARRDPPPRSAWAGAAAVAAAAAPSQPLLDALLALPPAAADCALAVLGRWARAGARDATPAPKPRPAKAKAKASPAPEGDGVVAAVAAALAAGLAAKPEPKATTLKAAWGL